MQPLAAISVLIALYSIGQITDINLYNWLGPLGLTDKAFDMFFLLVENATGVELTFDLETVVDSGVSIVVIPMSVIIDRDIAYQCIRFCVELEYVLVVWRVLRSIFGG